ncbi:MULTISPECIES: hypothetical protein [Acidithiobacillus]|jgi:hypothetical protein|uniref:Uncharacterized protein n=3 Tax=Acidithiobacillus caldus TaxID=33059 RepID=F9ZS26_ACICS|nr:MULTISPECIES: hypothetical protein [Acidithiobacillus]AEK58835.1 conserved hypothetical protein [Acidithiobacillus caldus SM-1]AIA55871.1 hypothetical protein Acaty_c2014 [Acidithiobacillus caldus ATCC 51756]AUW33247.1 hypothetical protein A5904_10350 [Acidithiobacillus caldus]MBU2729994.1 hypothetical protein [Acidithiobacillus caldus]MBU2736606.1 hypothetical protein [Acidithiobacillus caldus ATCC 51756]
MQLKRWIPSRDTPDTVIASNTVEEVLDALEEKHEVVNGQLQDLLRHMDAAHPDELLDRVLAVDKEMRKYRRFFSILKSHLLQGADGQRLSGGTC